MEEKWTKKDTVNFIFTFLSAITISIIALIIIRTYICSFTVVSGESMSPNIKNNEVLLLEHLSQRKENGIDRYDVIVFKPESKNYCYVKPPRLNQRL